MFLPYREIIRGHVMLLKPMRYLQSSSKLVNTSSQAKPVLYGDEASPPVRFVMMTASYLGVELDFHRIDIFSGENKTEFYSKINPLQKVPALVVENEVIIDSHAIALYLCRIANKKELYPEDILLKAKVDEILFFNSGALFPIDSTIYSAFFAGSWPVDDALVRRWNSLLDYLENNLSRHKWVTDDKIMLCDFCCAATISSLRLLLPPLERHVKVNQWIKKLNEYPCFDFNVKGLERLNYFVDKMKQYYESNKN